MVRHARKAMAAIETAHTAAKEAYEFSPNSYTWSALSKCLDALELARTYMELDAQQQAAGASDNAA